MLLLQTFQEQTREWCTLLLRDNCGDTFSMDGVIQSDLLLRRKGWWHLWEGTGELVTRLAWDNRRRPSPHPELVTKTRIQRGMITDDTMADWVWLVTGFLIIAWTLMSLRSLTRSRMSRAEQAELGQTKQQLGRVAGPPMAELHSLPALNGYNSMFYDPPPDRATVSPAQFTQECLQMGENHKVVRQETLRLSSQTWPRLGWVITTIQQWPYHRSLWSRPASYNPNLFAYPGSQSQTTDETQTIDSDDI